MKGHVGRPKSMKDVDLMSIDDCLKRMQEELKLDKPPFARGTILNKFWSGQLTRYGTYHHPQVDWNEAKKLLHWKRRVG